MPKNVQHTLKGAIVHMEDEPLFGPDLVQRIKDDVKASQLFAGVLLPNELWLTQAQHNSIVDATSSFAESFLFNSGLCVMEIVIVDKDEQ